MTNRFLDEAKTEDLIEELDRRLREQGFDTEKAGVEVLMDYLKDGWTLIAVPKDVADRIDGTLADEVSLHSLVAEIRHALAERKEFGEQIKGLIAGWRTESENTRLWPQETKTLKRVAAELEALVDPAMAEEMGKP